MARGIQLADYQYEVDEILPDGTREVNAQMLLRMDKFNIGTGAKNIKVSANTQVTRIAAHISLYLNEKEFGVRPRFLVGELVRTAQSSACYGSQPKRIIQIPVLTLAQFDTFRVFNKFGAATQANTLVTVNHSFDGSAKSDYKIIRKVDQRLI